MTTRQAIYAAFLFILMEFSACAVKEIPPTPTSAPLPAAPTYTATRPSPTVTATPQKCLTEPGRIEQVAIETTVPPQEFLVYLPPCYDVSTESYPVLYLLHGQTYRQDQWVRIGATGTADRLIHNGHTMPFLMVFPDDRYWNVPAGATFGERLLTAVIPYVDANYRVLAGKKFRALGGLSRGGGWTAKLGFTHPQLFGALGFHSPALFKDNAPYLDAIIKNISEEERPRLWHDIGDADTLLGDSLLFESVLIQNDYPHTFHQFAGDHTENYWTEHVAQYLKWYAKVWQENLTGQ